MNANTPQQLGRTGNALDDHGCDDTTFCLDCFRADLQHDDFRGDLAFLAVLRMKKVVAIRVEQDGISLEDAWGDILSGARCVADTKSSDATQTTAATQLSEVLADYLVHRLVLSHPEPRPIEVHHKQMEIVQRTYARIDEIGLEGSTPDLLEPIN